MLEGASIQCEELWTFFGTIAISFLEEDIVMVSNELNGGPH